MKRQGKTLKTLPDGAPRRLADGRNAWRKMSGQQRAEFLVWLTEYDWNIIPSGFSITVPKGWTFEGGE